MDNSFILLLLAIAAILDIWGEVLVEWGFMLSESDLPLFRLREVDGMDWWFMLSYFHDHLLVHCDRHMP